MEYRKIILKIKFKNRELGGLRALSRKNSRFLNFRRYNLMTLQNLFVLGLKSSYKLKLRVKQSENCLKIQF